jgi:hypothetical protein
MSEIILTEKQLELVTNKLLIEQEFNKLSKKQTLNESFLGIENMLMIAGFVPVIGEIADIALICYYLYKGEKLYAALMLIALIPTVGDFIAKPIIRLFKGSREGSVALKAGGAKLTEYLAKNPQVASKYSSLGKYINTPAVEKTIEGISKVNSGWGSSLKAGLKEITGIGALGGLKSGAKEVMAGGKFGSGLKGYYQGERLSKYFNRKGIPPDTGIKRWWLKVGARQDRRNDFRKFIGANNLLAYFGIPSITTFERKMSDDAEFRKKIAEDPKTSDYIAQNYNSDDNVPLSNNDMGEVTKGITSTSISDNPIARLFGQFFGGK